VLVEAVGDLAAVLDRANHVVDRRPVDGAFLGVYVGDVVLDELDARREVGLRELVRDVEAERAELAPLLDDSVHEGEREKHRAPGGIRGARDRVQVVLGEPRVRAVEAGADARGRLVGHLDRHVQQADREEGVRLGRDPAAELVVYLLGLGGALLNDRRLELAHHLEAEVAVLEQHPAAHEHALLQQLARRGLLALAHRDGADLLLHLARELVDRIRRVRSRRQDEDGWDELVRLLGERADVERARVGVPLAERVHDVLLHAKQGAVLAQRADEQQLVKVHLDPVVEVRYFHGLGAVLVVPVLPHGVVASDRVRQIAIHGHRARELDDVQPGRVGDPRGRLRLLGVGVERTAADEEHLLLRGGETARDGLDAHREHQRPDVLMAHEEATLHVAGDVEVSEVDDVDDALSGDRRGRRVGERVVKKPEELLERQLVHDVDGRHVDDQKVEQRAARGHRPVLGARDRDALSGRGSV